MSYRVPRRGIILFGLNWQQWFGVEANDLRCQISLADQSSAMLCGPSINGATKRQQIPWQVVDSPRGEREFSFGQSLEWFASRGEPRLVIARDGSVYLFTEH